MLRDNDKQLLAALESLFRRFYKPLRAYAFRFVNHKAVSEDIVQDVFLELWERRDGIRFDEPDAVKSYLFKSVHNHAINILNATCRHDFCSLDDVDESIIRENSSHAATQEHSIFLKELETEIAAFTDTLPPQCRKIFLLSRTHGLKNREIAEQLNITLKAVEKQVNKALTGLRKHLRERGLLFVAYLFYHLY
jgi:RNA polymerase sigma-70 factor (ECF subfamily)